MKQKYPIFLAALAFFLTGAIENTTAAPLRDLFEDVRSSVVVIQTKEHRYSSRRSGEVLYGGAFGSGVIISEDGLIFTSRHLVHLADMVNVKLADGRIFNANVLGTTLVCDVALIRLDKVPEGLQAAKLGDSDKVAIGEPVFIVGAPYGIEHTLTVGHVSGRRKPDTAVPQLLPTEYLQTDAAINQGNSGGPMFNMEGEVVGIVSHILSKSGGYEGLGFATSINTAKEHLLNQNALWTGIELIPLDAPLAAALNVPQKIGLMVQRVANNSLGKKLGLVPGKIPVKIGIWEFFIGGDIILSIQGVKVTLEPETVQRLREIMAQSLAKGSVTMQVLRKGRRETLTWSP